MDVNKELPKYQSWNVVREIGKGSYGSVYEVEKKDGFGYVSKSALKIISVPSSRAEIDSMRNSGMTGKNLSDYFYQSAMDIVKEFELMEKLKGTTNIVSCEDHEIHQHEDGIGWDIMIRMELLTSLNSYLTQNQLTRRDVIRLGIDICQALERCQTFNIIHRDIKPDNIFVSSQGDFKLGDFGVAKTVEQTMGEMSHKGTYNFMAPEIYKRENYGFNVDIYSLGIVMYRLLNNNRPPFYPPYPNPVTHEEQELALYRRMQGEQIPLPCQDHTRLAEIVLKACSYEQENRYSSPTMMRTDLEAILYSAHEQKTIINNQDVVPFPPTDITTVDLDEPVTPRNTETVSETETLSNPTETATVISVDNPPPLKGFMTKILRGKNVLIALLIVLAIGGSYSGYYFYSTVSVPTLSGASMVDVEDTLHSLSLVPIEGIAENSDTVPKGKVIRIEESGHRISKNSTVTVIKSLGISVDVPSVLGKSERESAELLKSLGLSVVTEAAYSDDVEEGNIIAQDAEAGTKLNEDDTITVTVSLGSQPFKIKDYTKYALEKAKKKATDAGLIVKTKKEYSLEFAEGEIISQKPVANKKVRKGDTVTFTISKGAKQVEVPNLYGMSVEDARTALENAGLTLGDTSSEYNSSVSKDNVCAQGVDAGNIVNERTSVSIILSKGKKSTTTSNTTGSKTGGVKTGSGSNKGGSSKKKPKADYTW